MSLAASEPSELMKTVILKFLRKKELPSNEDIRNMSRDEKTLLLGQLKEIEVAFREKAVEQAYNLQVRVQTSHEGLNPWCLEERMAAQGALLQKALWQQRRRLK